MLVTQLRIALLWFVLSYQTFPREVFPKPPSQLLPLQLK